MNFIDNSLQVSWCVELQNGDKVFASDTDRGNGWIALKESMLASKKSKISRMHLFNTRNATSDTEFYGANTPLDKDGYFFAHKILAMFKGPSVDMWGIGYINDAGSVDVRWYDQNMSLIDHEVRSIDTCLFGLIMNERKTV